MVTFLGGNGLKKGIISRFGARRFIISIVTAIELQWGSEYQPFEY